MKNVLCMFICSVMLGAFMMPAYAEDSTIYVSKNGNDNGDGSSSAPYATLNKAIEASKGISGGVTINIESGKYPLVDTINLTEEDSDISIIANGDVTLSGGNEIPYSSFKKVSDSAVLSRIIEKTGRDAVVCANLKELGVTDYGKIRVQGFFGRAR